MPPSILPNPFDQPGHWYRGCLHVHTTESDGSMPPERILAHYRNAYYDFVALTDHETVTDRSALSSDEFLVLRGIEVGVGRTEHGQTYHVVGIGLGGDYEARSGRAPQEAIDAINRSGGTAIVAHPYWSGLTSADLLSLLDYAALEVFNTGCEGEIGRGYSHWHWDELLTRGVLTRAVASDDSHWPIFDALHAWTMVRAPELSVAAILDALRKGHFYASTGPEIRAVRLVDGDRVEVECSPARSIALVCDPTFGGRVGVGRVEAPVNARRRRSGQGFEGLDGRPLTGATFSLRVGATYARVVVTDERGLTAWSNPVFLNS
jgi:hypothetical protein